MTSIVNEYIASGLKNILENFSAKSVTQCQAHNDIGKPDQNPLIQLKKKKKKKS